MFARCNKAFSGWIYWLQLQSVCYTTELLYFHLPLSKNTASLSQPIALVLCFIDPLSETVWRKMPITQNQPTRCDKHTELCGSKQKQEHMEYFSDSLSLSPLISLSLSLSLSVSSEKRKLQVNIVSPIHCSMNGRKCTVVVETKINQSHPDFTKSRSGYILSVPGN